MKYREIKQTNINFLPYGSSIFSLLNSVIYPNHINVRTSHIIYIYIYIYIHNVIFGINIYYIFYIL